ncbi:hypothetical protein [Magnetospirillum sulfuroxidans]|uniref:Uncharacterized protein n=1 Tax=Magnetospirillum sulfuroxidans TaxID=611300 RepID=A0ABS5I8L6_9PROT|nr:hypothetical protein [Magnetospirillum sulfuroxidans]MBR9970781.1 hypothetical protein [Magnetospirillum sulfuroxidans]
MQAVSAQPSPALLQRLDRPDNHDTRKQENASQSVFASYAFGPMDLNKNNTDTDKKDGAGISGAGLGKNPLSAASLSFVTSVQDVGSSSDGGGQKAF